jgi:hypothetical protein
MRACEFPGCGQRKNGSRHFGPDADHAYQAPPKERKAPKRMGLSTRPNRVQRRQEVAEARSTRRAAVSYCEAKSHGIASPCGVGPDATLEASHVYSLGMGGGAEQGEIRMLEEAEAMHRRMVERVTLMEAADD